MELTQEDKQWLLDNGFDVDGEIHLYTNNRHNASIDTIPDSESYLSEQNRIPVYQRYSAMSEADKNHLRYHRKKAIRIEYAGRRYIESKYPDYQNLSGKDKQIAELDVQLYLSKLTHREVWRIYKERNKNQ